MRDGYLHIPNLGDEFKVCNESRTFEHLRRLFNTRGLSRFLSIGGVLFLCYILSFIRIYYCLAMILGYNYVSLLLFHIRSITSTYKDFVRLVEKSNGQMDNRFLQRLLTCKEYYTNSKLVNIMITALVPLLCVIFPVPGNKVTFTYSILGAHRKPEFSFCSIESVFRRYLSVIGGIARPVSPNDAYWIIDTPQNRCQIMGLAVVDDYVDPNGSHITLTVNELRHIVLDNLVPSDPKLTSYLTHKFGRSAWQPMIVPDRRHWGDKHHLVTRKTDCIMIGKISELLMPSPYKKFFVGNKYGSTTHLDANRSPDESLPSPPQIRRRNTEIDFTIETPPVGCFDIANHVYEIHIDSTQSSVHEVISELASSPLSSEAPPWRIVLLKIHNYDSLAEGLENLVSTTLSSNDSTIFSDNEMFVDEKRHDTCVKSCVIFQCHHALGDGTALMYQLLKHFFDPTEELRQAEQFNTSRWQSLMFLAIQVARTLIFGITMLTHWTLKASKPPATFQSRAGPCLQPRFQPIGTKYLSPPVLISIDQINRLRNQIKDLLRDYSNFQPTLNDVMMCCVTRALKRLRTGEAVADIMTKLRRRDTQDNPKSNSRTPWNTTNHVCKGRTPSLINRDFDLGSPSSKDQDLSDEQLRSSKENLNTVQLMMPMNCRLGTPTKMDNFTATVITYMPLPSSNTNSKIKNMQWPPEASTDDKMTLQHLYDVKRHIDIIKNNKISWQWFLLSCTGALILTESLINVQMLVTNVKGPSGPLSIAGKYRVASLQFWPPAKGELTGGIAFFSFENNLQISTIFDEVELRKLLPKEKWDKLGPTDRSCLSQYTGNLIKIEFQNLSHQIRNMEAKRQFRQDKCPSSDLLATPTREMIE